MTMLEKTSKIYIAGHNGLVGSAIWNNLKSRGYNNLIGRSHRELDLTDQYAVRKFFDEETPDAVVLAAAFVGGIMANSLYRADFIMMNMKIQCNVISEAYIHGVKKLLFLGSTCIYPKNAPQPMKEDCLLTSSLEYTNEEYAIAKIAGLKMCESYNLQYGTNYIAVMPTNLYGPNDNFHLENSHVMPAMMRKVYLAKLINDNNWEAIWKDLSIRPVGANIKENGETVRYIIDGITYAYRRSDCAVQFKFLHILQKIQYIMSGFHPLFHGKLKHILGIVHTDHIVSVSCKNLCHRTCTTSKFQHNSVFYAIFA